MYKRVYLVSSMKLYEGCRASSRRLSGGKKEVEANFGKLFGHRVQFRPAPGRVLDSENEKTRRREKTEVSEAWRLGGLEVPLVSFDFVTFVWHVILVTLAVEVFDCDQCTTETQRFAVTSAHSSLRSS
jgi:hypothetical protein